MKRSIVTAILLLLILLAACGRVANSADEADNYVSDDIVYVPPEDLPSYVPLPYQCPLDDVFTSGSTRGEYLYDLDYLYNVMLENFPFFDSILRAYGVDMHAHFINTREHVLGRDDFPSDAHFAASLNNFFIREARFVGQLLMLNSDSIMAYIRHFNRVVEQGDTRYMPFLDELNNPATRAFYDLTDEDFISPPEATGSTAVTSDNVHFDIIEEGRIAYINITSLNHAAMETDRVTLLDFFHEVADYEHLILDIRQISSAGYLVYFVDLFMRPNISYPLRFENYVFFMGGEHGRRLFAYWFEAEDGINPIVPDSIANMPYFPADNLYMFNYYLHHGFYIEPNCDSGIFNGKIWLLTSQRNAAAAAGAAAVAKQTGFATLVGLQTGSGLGLLTPPFIVALPNTGIVVSFGAGYHTDNLGRDSFEHGTQPHYFNRPGMSALDTVLAMIEEGSY